MQHLPIGRYINNSQWDNQNNGIILKSRVNPEIEKMEIRKITS